MRYWSRTNLPVGDVRRRAMLYFGKEATGEMALVTREPNRLLFSDPLGDLTVQVEAGQPNIVSVSTTHWHTQAQDFLMQRVDALGGLVHYESETTWPAQEILRRARDYFGQSPEGLGLALTAEQPQSLEFTGGGGQVTVHVHANKQPLVRVSAREWNHHAEEFVRLLSSER